MFMGHNNKHKSAPLLGFFSMIEKSAFNLLGENPKPNKLICVNHSDVIIKDN